MARIERPDEPDRRRREIQLLQRPQRQRPLVAHVEPNLGLETRFQLEKQPVASPERHVALQSDLEDR
jgi:hypothetical protein